MADPAFYAPASVYPRRKFSEFQDNVSQATGLSRANQTHLTILKGRINDAISIARRRFGGVRGLGEATVQVTIALGDERTELPADFASLRPKAEAVLLDSSLNPSEAIPIIDRDAVQEGWNSGRSSAYEDRQDGILYIFGVSTNKRRMLWRFPAADESLTYQIDYIRQLERLVNDADEIEAAPEFNLFIEFTAASLFWTGEDVEKAAFYDALAEKQLKLLANPVDEESGRPARFRSFEEVKGYDGFHFPDNQVP